MSAERVTPSRMGTRWLNSIRISLTLGVAIRNFPTFAKANHSTGLSQLKMRRRNVVATLAVVRPHAPIPLWLPGPTLHLNCDSPLRRELRFLLLVEWCEGSIGGDRCLQAFD